MIASSLSALALLGVVSAQSTVSIFFPEAGGDSDQSLGLAASATVDGTLTTYVLNCASTGTASSAAPTSTDDSDLDLTDPEDACAYISGFSIVEGPSTMLYSSAYDGVSVTIDCSIGGTTTAVCTERANGTDVDSTTFASSDMFFYPVTVTAGDAKAGSSATATGASASSTGSASSGASTKASASKASATGASASTSTSTGGMPQMTAGAWAVGAGAVLAAVVAL